MGAFWFFLTLGALCAVLTGRWEFLTLGAVLGVLLELMKEKDK